jgi:hypothetical protein
MLYRQRVLLGENFRWRHDGGLEAALDRQEHRQKRDDGFAAPDIALEEAVHRVRLTHIVENLRQYTLLRSGELKWELGT